MWRRHLPSVRSISQNWKVSQNRSTVARLRFQTSVRVAVRVPVSLSPSIVCRTFLSTRGARAAAPSAALAGPCHRAATDLTPGAARTCL
ncbi:hypothetical protein PsYK624_076620 [Phanerochaete sordida]|uniref:Uncharacterized protein n=1 Tax=Phanerochaete sordida TaxID=48140 RepID=A0A9P3LEZ8_9APHY|nr:hypothetical protein PsYK624_076620 [Phanerochaete sordida]